ncbi:MAG TPA: hypothetical protein VFU01_09430, partial [Gemmatimonadaceae bacterium]|nr:hypothetical protein [Gemmatimonadaceae bacterium]
MRTTTGRAPARRIPWARMLALLPLLGGCSREDRLHADNRPSSQASGGTCDTAARKPDQSPPPGGGVSVRVERLVGGCGAVLVSSGLPLPPGMLTKGNLSRVRVVVGGVERAVYLEALHGAHADGSLRSILIQFTDTLAFGAPRDGYVIIGQPRGTTDIARPTADRGSPAAVILPSDPAYLVSTGLVGPTVPVSTTTSWPAVYQTYEQNFRTFADYHWNLNGATWTENYYDRAQIYYAWWLRTAQLEYWRRATALALSYRRDYLEASNYNPSAHWSQLEGQELHYLATGDDASRRAVG